MLRLIVQCDCETLTFLAPFGTEYIALVPEQLTTFLQAEVPALIPGTAGSRAGKHSANNIEIMGFKGKHCTLLHQKWTLSVGASNYANGLLGLPQNNDLGLYATHPGQQMYFACRKLPVQTLASLVIRWWERPLVEALQSSWKAA